jgi:YYY domain-containing protein
VRQEALRKPSQSASSHSASLPFRAGLAAVVALLLLGNLGTVRMYWQGFQQVVVPADEMKTGTLIQHFTWAAQGIGRLVTQPGTSLPYSDGDWYWKPSRAIQPEDGNEITEFPIFTFLYADLHAHLIALPVTLLVAAWALGMVLGKGRWGLENGRLKKTSLGLALVLGALAAGALRPANTWDQYTYLTLAALMLAYSQWRAGTGGGLFRARWLNVLAPTALLVLLAVLLYAPFDAWFEQGYNALELWKGARTGLGSYLVHWGLFLFVIVAWLFDEMVDWMAHTPVSALRRLGGYREAAMIGALAAGIALLALLVQGVWIALVVVPVGLWVTVLMFRPDLPDAKRFVLFMIGTALLLTLAVELVAVKGDIGRMNTVFKFYYQAWTLLALSAAAGLAWLWGKLRGWNATWGTIWMVGLVLLVIGAALYPLTAARGKILDRMAADAPHTLDGMAFMEYAQLVDGQNDQTSIDMDLSQDYRAIHWMQQNVPGSPVIVEANTPEYRHWGTRVTIYTGLPGVVGWNWHERQQRTVTPDTWVYQRIDDITAFYQTTDADLAKEFLRKYNVQYVILGQVEKAWYPGAGLGKFDQLNGVLWDKVYNEGQTAIYKVRN